VNDLAAVRVLPALDWWAGDARDAATLRAAPLRLAADVVLAHRAFTLAGEVGRCGLSVSNPGLKAPMVSALEAII